MATPIFRARVARTGDFLRDHQIAIRRLQWMIVGVYVFLLVVPALLPLPGRTASVFNNLTIVAQFAFWGLWWPFVLISIPLFGRAWCGLFCPEGALTEWASRHGRGGAIPRWMRWGGWPFVAFGLTTVYGQLVSVYQYPWAVAAVLGGSTIAAMVIGYLYGKNKRVWCKYLCPVNGVFNLLAKLSPWYYRVDAEAWRAPVRRTESINCAPLLPLRNMEGAAECHMCGRCSDYRGAITLSPRSPEAEIVYVSGGNAWQTALIVFGLMGLAVGAFLWSASPWYVTIKQGIATWLVNRDLYWPLADNAPWFILTHYPQVNDSFSWLDGAVILVFIAVTTFVVGGITFVGLWLADRVLPVVVRPGVRDTRGALVRSPLEGVHKLAQGLIPAAGIGVFLGLSATTLTLLQHEGVPVGWANPVRFTLLSLALAWSLRFQWRLAGLRTLNFWRRSAAVGLVAAGLVPFVYCWVLFFIRW
ncbi:MAG TPA: 4Fe-4S binding protein [Castellaniella sp.]|uniref:4Fe-4S binding protein n=1 Tax=Castellaniella sp. TaxID=1955812 RepID=UPI002F14C63D